METRVGSLWTKPPSQLAYPKVTHGSQWVWIQSRCGTPFNDSLGNSATLLAPILHSYSLNKT